MSENKLGRGEKAPKKWRIRTRASKNKKALKQNGNRLRRQAEKQFPLPDWIMQPVLAVLVTLIVEALCRRSISGAFSFIADNPLAFLLNCTLVAFTIAIAMMFKRRVFTLALGAGLWVLLAIANYTVMSRRGRLALYPADLHGITEGIVVIPKLFNWWQVALIVGVLVLAVAGFVVLLLKTHKYRRDLNRSTLRLVSTALAFTILLLLCLESNKVTRTLRPDFYASYKKNGFSYSFVFGLFDQGMEEPTNYTDQAVQDIIDRTGGEPVASTATMEREDGTNAQRLGLVTGDTSIEGYDAEAVERVEPENIQLGADEDLPNIIFLQLEAFCDPQKLSEYEYEGEPIPMFRRLQSAYTTGILYVPTVAGGTCNTEFEALTGCNLDLFGANEYPYYGLVRNAEFESLAQDLKPFGYTSTFLHDYSGTFYNRNIVYSNLGFDRFCSIEYMNDYDETVKGWAKDSVLEKYIMQSLESTAGKDFIMAVGVQTHSAYPELPDEDARFLVTKAPDDSEQDRLAFQYYLEQMYEVDSFLGALIDRLSAYEEKVVLVIYGDHLPGIRFNHDEMTTEELFSTSYVIWSNYGLDKADRDLEAYQLSAYTLLQADIPTIGAMPTVHQSFMDAEYDSYLRKMQLVQYDITYGDHYWYGGKNIERKSEMQFGVTPIFISALRNDSAGNLFVYGQGFTRDAGVYIDDRAYATIFVSEELLIVQDAPLGDEDEVEIRFYGADGILLSAVAYEAK